MNFQDVKREAAEHGVRLTIGADRIDVVGDRYSTVVLRNTDGTWSSVTRASDGGVHSVRGNRTKALDVALSYVIDGPF